MTKLNFTVCLNHTLKHEGGYVDHPRDPGGATNMGITIGTLSAFFGRPASKDEVRSISRTTVALIYQRNYWNAVRADDLPDGFDLVAFDGAVNSGPARGARWLQKGLGVPADGNVGPQTITAAVTCLDGVKAIQRACAARLGFLRGLGTWNTFGRGWGRRVAGVEAEAVAMHTRSRARVEAEVPRAEAKAKGEATAAASGGAGAGSSGVWDMPDLALYGLIALGVLVMIVFLRRAAQDRRRAQAYRAKAMEMANG